VARGVGASSVASMYSFLICSRIFLLRSGGNFSELKQKFYVRELSIILGGGR